MNDYHMYHMPFLVGVIDQKSDGVGTQMNRKVDLISQKKLMEVSPFYARYDNAVNQSHYSSFHLR